MKINLNNYEEFFLMYADNELSPQDRKDVEEFIDLNPTIRDEFLLIKDAVLKPEVDIFDNKNLLYRKESFDTVQEYQERLNLYIDNELNPTDKLKLEEIISGNAMIKKEVDMLMLTKSVPDLNIIYPDKFLLYKKDEKTTPVFWFRWVAAAAVIIGFGLFSINYFTASHSSVIDKSNFTVAPKKQIPAVLKDQSYLSVNKNLNEDVTAGNTDVKVTGAPVQSANREDIKIKKVPDQGLNQKENNQTAKTEIKKPTNHLPQPDPTFNNKRSNPDVAVSEPEKGIDTDVTPAKENTVTPKSAFTLQQVSYVERDENNDDGNKNIAEKFHKSKLGSFLKKASRTIARNLKVDRNDDQN